MSDDACAFFASIVGDCLSPVRCWYSVTFNGSGVTVVFIAEMVIVLRLIQVRHFII